MKVVLQSHVVAISFGGSCGLPGQLPAFTFNLGQISLSGTQEFSETLQYILSFSAG